MTFAPIVLDNTVLSNFALARSTDLIFQLWADRSCTTPAVLNEHRVGVAEGTLPVGEWSELSVTELSLEEERMSKSLPGRLGIGERSCLAVALCRGGGIATDDLDARKTAIKLGAQVTGSVGILIASFAKGILNRDEANSRLADMIAHGYHAPAEKIEDLLSLAP